MSTTIDRLKLFPETVGTHSNEDGIGTYHDRHATSVVAQQPSAPCHCGYDAKADVAKFEESRAWWAYTRGRRMY